MSSDAGPRTTSRPLPDAARALAIQARAGGPSATAPDLGRNTASPAERTGADAYAPREVAERVNQYAALKATLPLLSLTMLGVLAGAFIGLGALLYALVASDTTLGFAAGRLLGGIAFSLGLILVTVAGAELFTGNNLLAMAWAAGRIDGRAVLRNWVVACSANFGGAAGLAWLVWLSGHPAQNGGAIARTVVAIATAKAQLPPSEAFWRGVLCNVLVCIAVWMVLAGRSVTDKAVAIVFPITAFVAAGFEHSIANMYYFPLAMLLGAPLGWADCARNLLPVIAGNLVGGSVLVALVYYVIYLRPGAAERAGRNEHPRHKEHP